MPTTNPTVPTAPIAPPSAQSTTDPVAHQDAVRVAARAENERQSHIRAAFYNHMHKSGVQPTTQ